MHRTLHAVAVLLSVLALAAPAAARQAGDGDARRLLATRPTLEALAQQLDSIVQSPAASGKARRRAASQARLIRSRLEVGDFRAGDRIALLVEGEKDLTDTFTVAPFQELTLPRVGPVPLQGVLRSEIQAQLATAVSRIMREPVVRARALIRVSVQGEVIKPGFVDVPPEALLSDVLNAAGGLTKDAKLQSATLERGGDPILEGDELRQFLEESQTLDALGVRSGDQFIIPRRSNTFDALRTAAVVLAIPVTIYSLLKIF